MTHHTQENGTKQHAIYRIAGLVLELVFPEKYSRSELLPSFEPFLEEFTNESEEFTNERSICTIELVFSTFPPQEDRGELLSDISIVWGDRFGFYEKEDEYITTVKGAQDDRIWAMKSSKDFSQSVIYSPNGEQSASTVLSWLIMVAFGQTCLLHGAVLIHASAIVCNEKGYAFLGKSGTGKTTHSKLWLEHVGGSELINDDNPAVRLEDDGQVYVYGTPWSGKTACYRNIKVPVQAFVRLKQASSNKIKKKEGIEAFVCVLPSCTAIRWNKHLFTEMNNTVEAIVQQVTVAELACLPNPDAANLCHQSLITSRR